MLVLLDEVAALRRQVAGHVERIAAQSEILSRRAERPAAGDLARMRELAGEVTPGPLRVETDGGGHYCLRAPHQTERTVARVYCDLDAEFIALAWSAVPALLADRRAVPRPEPVELMRLADDGCPLAEATA